MDDFAPQARRVLSMEKSGAGNAAGAKKRMEYLGMTTRVTAVTDAESEAGKAITYQFNASGNVVSMFDELGYAQSTKFSATLPNTPEQALSLIHISLAVPDFGAIIDSGGKFALSGRRMASTADFLLSLIHI